MPITPMVEFRIPELLMADVKTVSC